MYEEILEDTEKVKILARVVSHLMGDGCVQKRYFAYYNKNLSLLEGFKQDVSSLFGNVHFITGKVNSGTSFYMIQDKNALNFLKSLLEDYRSFSLHIPKFVNTREIQKEFLKAIFDDEGCVGLRIFKKTGEIKRDIHLASKSLRFIEELKEVLQKSFNIGSNKINIYDKKMGEKKFRIYTLYITGKENFEKFRESINFYHPDKKEKINLMINSYIRK